MDLSAFNPMVPKVYPDLNFLIDARDAPGGYRRALTDVAAHQVQFVFSHWHLVEIARARDAAGLVELVLSLKPVYLHERTVILRQIIKGKVNQHLGIKADAWEPIGTLEEVVGELLQDSIPEGTLDLRTVISGLSINQAPIQAAYLSNRNARDKYLRSVKAQSLTCEMKVSIDHAYWLQFFPDIVSTLGVVGVLDARTKRNILRTLDLSDILISSVETAVTEDGHHTGVKLREQMFFDRQHMTVGLPYTDFIVTSDQGFIGIVDRIRPQLPFEVAQVVTKPDFDRRFLASVHNLEKSKPIP